MGSHVMNRRAQRVAILAILLPAAGWMTTTLARAQSPARSDTPVPHGQDRAPNAPRSTADAIRAMTVPPGFRVERVAAEPEIVNPVAMTFDERGRIWITESLEYPRRQPGPGQDRVKVLDDTDGDGQADTFTVFATGLNIPSGIAVGHGGVWVANSPDILFLQDRDGDGVADAREVVATGFGRHDTHELPNSLTWGPDGWLYGWNGVFNPSKVVSRNGTTYAFTCAIFRIHPRTRVFEIWCEGTSNPWGIAIDPEGSFFSSACVIDHLWHLVETGYYIRQGGPYPQFTWPIGSIVDHTHQKAAYCGIHYFDSPAYPAQYRGRLYMGNIHGNSINVDMLERNGSTYRAVAAPDFLQANDAWFMPVSQKTGPDGCLYILDWYDRYHCYQDANRDPAGIDRLKGRLYRVRYKDAPRRFGFDLARLSDDDLIGLLGNANVYDRDTAQRLLSERASPGVRGTLQWLVLDEGAARTARMHGLWALMGTGALDPAFHVKLLNHNDPAFRAWGVRAAGNKPDSSLAICARVAALAHDPSPDVRLQVAVAARKLTGLDPLPVLLDVERESQLDPLIPHIVWQNLHPSLESRQAEIARRLEDTRGIATGFRPLAPRAIEKLLDSPRADTRVIGVILSGCLSHDEGLEAIDLLAERFRDRTLAPGFEERLRRELIKVVKDSTRVLRFPHDDACAVLLAYCGESDGLEAARLIAREAGEKDDRSSRSAREAQRLRAFRALVYREPPAQIRSLVGRILSEADAASSVDFRGNVLDSLGRTDNPELAPVIIKAFAGLPAPLKPRAVELLTERPAWTKALLDAVAAGQIPAAALNVTQLRKLQRRGGLEIAGQVKAIWGTIRTARNARREQVVEQLRRAIRALPGDPIAGQAVFKKVCAQCHKLYGEGADVGPDVTASGRNDFEQLLSNVFDPNLVIGPGYQATTVATADGRILTGLLTEDGKDRVVLKVQGGKLETIARAQVDLLKTEVVSLMPEELEKQLTPQELADLFALLCLDRPPLDPAAKTLPGAGPMVRKAR
jgi:putative heme-binding domain-containing protein